MLVFFSQVYNKNMFKRRKKLLEMLIEFDKICKQHKVWYSLDSYSLLGIIRHSGFVPWVEKVQVMIDVEGFATLKRQFKNNIVDSSIDRTFKSLKAAWVNDRVKWNAEEQSFIEIRIVVPTTARKVAAFGSITNYIKRFLTFKKDNIKIAIDDLYDSSFEGFYVMGERHEKVRESWIQVLSFETEQRSFSHHSFPVIKEYDKFLTSIFGENYLNEVLVPHETFYYPFPNKMLRENS